MKRSQINKVIKNNIAFVKQMGFRMPPFSKWEVKDWNSKGSEYNHIRSKRLGWDVSDYGFGDFARLGIVAFTIRLTNGKLLGKYDQPYAEKY